MNFNDLRQQVIDLGPWFHNIEIVPGLKTREVAPAPGPQPLEHPLDRWLALKPHLPENLCGFTVLDLGSAEGFFSLQCAQRGAQVMAVDSHRKMVERLDFVSRVQDLNIETQVASAEGFKHQQQFDIIFNLGLLYHSKNPLLLLENIAQIKHKTMFLETTVTAGAEPYLYFKAPEAGVHAIPKWFPTLSCVVSMLEFVGYHNVENLPYDTPNRIFLKAERGTT